MAEKDNNRPGKQQIEAWKKQHGDLYQFTLPDGRILILRQPLLVDLERAMSADPKKKKPYNFHRSIIENCKLYEDEGALSVDKNLVSLYSQIDEIVEIADAEVKKL